MDVNAIRIWSVIGNVVDVDDELLRVLFAMVVIVLDCLCWDV